ncbi:S9 family peptidase [Alloacidobacterium dinghuense]|uniref:S9 family peptidase n=2 Tax=Alloacidobacterium dinghuense TaxID=2763107 RepID=A0A7G8BRJ0_9BACT|nr:S9 family peptidase [Alloacidobacterium dinghuense]
MTFEDMMKMRRLGDIAVSPDGHWVLFGVTDVDLAKNTRTSHLWIVPTAGGDEKPLTASLAGESRGRFSPDGKQILFQSARDVGQQTWLAPFDTGTGTIGDAHKLTSISTEADGAIWSPDGQNILFVSSVYPDCKDDACNKQRDVERAQSKVKAQVFTHLLYRHWNAFTGDKRSHLFLVSVNSGVPRDLTPGDEHDVPPFSLGGPDGYAFSPDGKEIAFAENLDPVPAISTNSDIFTLRLDDPNAKPVKISTSPGGDHSPAYSPDGKYIAWRSQARAGYESDRFRLMLYDRATGQERELLPKLDRWVDEFTWAPDSKTIYFASGATGGERILQANVEGPAPGLNVISPGGEYGDIHLSPDGKYLFASKQTIRTPSEIYLLELGHVVSTADVTAAKAHRTLYEPIQFEAMFDTVAEKSLTHLNDELLQQLDLPEMETFSFQSNDRTLVQGFLIKPPAFDRNKKYPVKFLIHGGPQGAWGDSWSYRWNAELLAANGYVVVMINPRGSTGYGQAFVDGVNGDWGGKPYIDLMRGLDYAEQHYSFIDKTRECALGASYGGYMADWILGHTNRFKCIVSHDGMFNPESAYGTTEELWFNEWEFKGTPWTNRALYRKWSPMLAETNFKTPTLVVHSQLDYRLDVSEGYQLFTTLQRMNVPSKMLYFPDEGHWVLKPQNSQLWYKTVNDWVDQWTKQ